MKRPLLFTALVLATIATTSLSRADSVAGSLFAEGKKLLADGHPVEACEKFDQSNRLEPGVGIRFHLARCHERIGRTAAAWTGYLEVAKAAQEQGQAVREKLARSLAAALEPRLTRLVLDVHDARSEGLTVTRNGVAIDRKEWATPILVDPGSVTLEAWAPGKKPWRTTMEISADKREWKAVVPDLEARVAAPTPERPPVVAPPVVAPSVAPPASEPDRSGPVRTVGLVVGGAGVLAIGAGASFALLAMSQDASARTHCEGDACDRAGVSLRHDAIASGNMSTIGFSIGGGLLVSGVALYFLSPSRDVPVAASHRVEVRAGLGRLDLRTQW